jgi:hypothetical protein
MATLTLVKKIKDSKKGTMSVAIRCSKQAATHLNPHLLKQGDLNDFVCDLNLSKIKAELFGSKRKAWNILHQDTEVFLSQSPK